MRQEAIITKQKIHPGELPDEAFLVRYRAKGAYTDCYVIELPHEVSFRRYVESFYTSWLFKLERWILTWLVRRPSSDVQARELALGERENFAAWHVEQRGEGQLLLCDFQGNTRSWLMCQPLDHGRATRLYFGSAIVPRSDPDAGEKRLGALFRLLLGFHKHYSRALLRATVSRLSHSKWQDQRQG